MDDQVQQSDTGSAPGRITGPDEKHCTTCGQTINIHAEICPKCGVRQRPPLSKTALLLLTFFLGGVGAHKFYVGKAGFGVLYLLFFWTLIPGLVALVEFFIYVFTDEDTLRKRYPSFKGNASLIVPAIVVGIFGVFFIPILAAVAIPLYVGYLREARVATVQATLAALYDGEHAYFQEHQTFTGDPAALNVTLPANTWFVFTINDVSTNTFTACATAQKSFGGAGAGDVVSIDQIGRKKTGPGLAKQFPEWK